MLVKKIILLALSLGSFLSTGSIPVQKEEASYTQLAIKENIETSPKRLSGGNHKVYEETCEEIEQLVDEGVLNEFHLKYYENPYYQVPYIKFKNANLLETKWYTEDEAGIKQLVESYTTDNEIFVKFINNLKTPVSSLAPNQALGIYYDGTCLNFLWSSEYLPFEDYNLQSITLNGETLRNGEIVNGNCTHINGDAIFELTDKYYLPKNNIQLNMTPIGGFCLNCIENDEYCSYGYGLDITTFNISGFTANFDPFYHGIDFGTEDEVLGTEYKIVSTDQHTFKLDKSCKEQKKSVLKSKNHCYIEIKDVECQTKFDLGFGGYMHCVYFNTSINLDFIYRVDVNYNLASDDKPFYNFIAKDGSMDVAKSLSPEIANGGFLGLGRYQGLTTGTFRSIQDNSKVYKYRLILNYDADGWNIFKGGEDESKYTNVHKFRMLRMNFIYNGEQYEEEIQMDAIEGDTLSFFDKEEIINVDSNYWEFRNGVNNIQDTLFGDKTKNVLLGVVGVLATIILVYVFLKLYRIFKKLFQTKE